MSWQTRASKYTYTQIDMGGLTPTCCITRTVCTINLTHACTHTHRLALQEYAQQLESWDFGFWLGHVPNEEQLLGAAEPVTREVSKQRETHRRREGRAVNKNTILLLILDSWKTY